MLKKFILALTLTGLFYPPAWADFDFNIPDYQNTGGGNVNLPNLGPILNFGLGWPGNGSAPTLPGAVGTGLPQSPYLPPTMNGNLLQGPYQLPPTTLEGFIKKDMDDMKYGDEGNGGPPPYNSYNPLDSGGTFDPGMTTGHANNGLPGSPVFQGVGLQ